MSALPQKRASELARITFDVIISLAILAAILVAKREGPSRLVRDGPETQQHQTNDNERQDGW
jgi:hypothetical protein